MAVGRIVVVVVVPTPGKLHTVHRETKISRVRFTIYLETKRNSTIFVFRRPGAIRERSYGTTIAIVALVAGDIPSKNDENDDATRRKIKDVARRLLLRLWSSPKSIDNIFARGF